MNKTPIETLRKLASITKAQKVVWSVDTSPPSWVLSETVHSSSCCIDKTLIIISDRNLLRIRLSDMYNRYVPIVLTEDDFEDKEEAKEVFNELTDSIWSHARPDALERFESAVDEVYHSMLEDMDEGR